jgi:hypothetical protein
MVFYVSAAYIHTNEGFPLKDSFSTYERDFDGDLVGASSLAGWGKVVCGGFEAGTFVVFRNDVKKARRRVKMNWTLSQAIDTSVGS